jgi:hypothetical protein
VNSDISLEALLQTLVNSPEEDKRALTRAAIGLLREVCNMYTKSSYPKFQRLAERARNILDQILIGKLEGSDEEEFLESADSAPATEISDSRAVEKSLKILEQEMKLSPLHELVGTWNKEVEPWLQIALPKMESVVVIKSLIKGAAAVRSNLVSAAAVSRRFDKESLEKFDKYWGVWVEEIQRQGYVIFPDKWGRLGKIEGQPIYSCRPSITEEEIAIITPGLKKKDEVVSLPVSLVSLPADRAFPQGHPVEDLPVHWRAILGELELLIQHLEIQNSVMCAIEAVNKARVEPFAQCSLTILQEIKRRGDALRDALKNKESIYRLATNYWRVEECFWAIFHEDGRPRGYSFFDRIRRRVQSWHAIIRENDKLYVRNFDSSKDSLASANKYLGNIILENRQGVSPGTILRELRPAVIVKVNNATRLLKGRVVAS